MNVQMYRCNARLAFGTPVARCRERGGTLSKSARLCTHTGRHRALPGKVRGGFLQEVKLEPSLKAEWDVTWQDWQERVFQEATGLGRHPRATELQEGGRA